MDHTSSLIDANFNWQTALTLAMSSKLVYQRASAVRTVVTKQWGYDRCDFISKKNTQLFVATKNNKLIICFRGTMGLADWLKNLDIAWTEDTGYGRVHSGFQEAFLDAKAALEEALTNFGHNKKIWVTGHSLGGALASICLAELADQWNDRFQGCYTFGQPRMGNRPFARFIGENYGARYFRFVNDDDIVCRIPPGYAHVGQVVHFAADGSLLSLPLLDGSDFEAFEEFPGLESSDGEAVTTEPAPLTEEEFERFKTTLEFGLETDVGSDLDPTVEGLLPSFSDHDIEKYINKIIQQERVSGTSATTEMAQIDLQVEFSAEVIRARSAFEGVEEGGLEGLEGFEAPAESALIPVLIRAAGTWQPGEDLTINSTIGSIYTALVTVEQLERLRHEPQIHSIQRSPESYLEECLVSIPFVKADVTHTPPENERGDQAIVGIIDTGIDVLHQAFSDGHNPAKSRILYIWDQRGSTSANRTPRDVNPNFSARYGRVYTQNEIEAFMAAGDTGTPPRLRNPGPLGRPGHGTHVAGIAAGRAVGMLGDGVAPEAKIAVVIPKLQTEGGDPQSLGYSVTHLDGLVFLREAAQIEGLPMAINVSLGMNAGSHDGTSTLEAGFDGITGQGRDPGLVIVKSAGNERGHHGHAKVFATKNLIETITWQAKDRSREQDYIEGWYDGFDDLEFVLIDPNGTRSPSLFFDPAVDNATQPKIVSGVLHHNRYELSLTKTHADNAHSLIQIVISKGDQGQKIQSGTWQLEILGREVVSQTGRVDFWIERGSSRAINFEHGADDGMTLSVPGTARSVITVGACAPEGPPIRLTSSSSYGPTRGGDEKPEITAPGDQIVAARSNTNNHVAGVAMTGTSMAAPHVTGAIVLAMSKLQKRDPVRQLNANQFRQLLIMHALDAARNHHPGRGFGILDVEKFLASL